MDDASAKGLQPGSRKGANNDAIRVRTVGRFNRQGIPFLSFQTHMNNVVTEGFEAIWHALLAVWHAVEHAIATIGHWFKHLFG